jgi:serine/threonine-protein kinase PpkA
MDITGYKIKKKIGKGAMATVFLADQLSLGRQVALKILAPALACQRELTVRFLNEGRIVAHLNHPQIVSVYDLGSHAPYHYLAMEFLPGGTLEQRIRAGMRPGQALQLITTICRALSFAHMHGVIHRDIKPQNILFRNDNSPVLTDFGIARLMNSDPGLTIPGRAVGSPLYMSPEQICGGKIDERSDLYAVGILFYKMLTNRLPYQSDQFTDIALMHKTAPIPVLPDDLSLFQPLMDKLLAKMPDERYANAQALIDALEHIESQHPFSTTDIHHIDFVGYPVRKLDGGKLHSIRERDGSTDDGTQPAIEPGAGGSADAPRIAAQGSGGPQSRQRARQMNPGAPLRKKSNITWKKKWIAAGGVLAVAGGIYGYGSFETPPRLVSKSWPPGKGEASPDHGLYRGRVIGQSTKPVPPAASPDETTARTQDPVDHRKKVEQKIAGLLAKAEKQLAAGSLGAPAGDNCYETYRQIVSLDPSSKAAESLLVKIGGAYHRLAKANQARGQIQNSLVNVGKGLMLVPEDKALLDLQAELKARLAGQTERLRQQARQIEQQKQAQAAQQAAMKRKQQAEQAAQQAAMKRKQQAEQAAQQAAMKRKQQAEAESVKNGATDVKPDRQTGQGVEPETEKAPQVKTETEHRETIKKEPARRNRLFGTF